MKNLMIALGLSVMLIGPASAAEVTVSEFGTGDDGRPVYALTIAGEIGDGDDGKVSRALNRAWSEGRFPGFVELRSSGGDTNAALGIAEIVHDFHGEARPILVRTRCTSACGIIALSAWRGRLFVVESGEIGLHQSWTCSHPDVLDPDCRKGRAVPAMPTMWRIAAVLQSYGVPKSVLDRMTKTIPDSMTYLDRAELEALGARVKR